MIIGIDASRYKIAQPTGVEVYSRHIIDGILTIFAKNNKNPTDLIRLYLRPEGENAHSVNNLFPKTKRIENVVIKQNYLWTILALSKELKKNRPDVLFVPSHTFPLFLGKKNIITIHDLAFKYFPDAYSFKEYHYLNWSTKFAVKKADKIIVPSCATADDLSTFYDCPPQKIKIIHHGLNINNLKSENGLKRFTAEGEVSAVKNIPENGNFILFVGRVEKKKNISRLIRAFSKLHQYFPNYYLVLAGKPGGGFNEIKDEFNNCGAKKNIIMTDFISECEKEILYRRCKFVILPSLYEGFGFPVLEAFYHQKPIIVSDIATMREIGGNAVYFVNPFDEEAIYKGMEVLLKDILEDSAKVPSTVLSENSDPHVQASTLRSKFSCRLASGTFAESSAVLSKNLVLNGNERLKLFSWQKAAAETYNLLYG